VKEALLGGIAVGNLVASLFFLRFWRSTRDRFFLLFGASFALEAANRVAMLLRHSWNEDQPLHYLVQLTSYGLILLAIWDRSRRP
jgi:hypothetical protein